MIKAPEFRPRHLDVHALTLLADTIEIILKQASRFKAGTYIGTGINRTLDIDVTPVVILIQRELSQKNSFPVVSQTVLHLAGNAASQILGGDMVATAVTGIESGKLSLGTHLSVNASGITYRYFLLG